MAPKSPQKTKLEDNAEIYKRRNPKSEKEKLSEMDFSEKVEYFKAYYLKKLLALLVIAGLLIWIIITIVTPKPKKVLSVAFSNYPISLELTKRMEADLVKLLDIDEEREGILLDTSYDLKNMDLASSERFTTYTYAGEIDIFIAPESVFLNYAYAEIMLPLDEQLPTDFYNSFAQDDFLVCRTRVGNEEDPSKPTGPEGVYGVYLTDTELFNVFDNTTDPPVLGLIVNTKNKDNAITFMKYLLNK